METHSMHDGCAIDVSITVEDARLNDRGMMNKETQYIAH